MARGNAAECLRAFLHRPDVRGRLSEEPGDPIRRLLPLKPCRRRTRTACSRRRRRRVHQADDGGGIFYSLLTRRLPPRRWLKRSRRVASTRPSWRATTRWNDRLGQEMRVADWLRGRLAQTHGRRDRSDDRGGGFERRPGARPAHRALQLAPRRDRGLVAPAGDRRAARALALALTWAIPDPATVLRFLIGSADGRRRRLSVVLFAGCAVAALTIRLAIAANTYGTNDMVRGPDLRGSFTNGAPPPVRARAGRRSEIRTTTTSSAGVSRSPVSRERAQRMGPRVSPGVSSPALPRGSRDATLIFVGWALRANGQASPARRSLVLAAGDPDLVISRQYDSIVVCLALAAVLARIVTATPCRLLDRPGLRAQARRHPHGPRRRPDDPSGTAPIELGRYGCRERRGLDHRRDPVPATFLQRTIGYAPNGGHFGFNVLLNGLVDALPHDQAPWWIARALRFAFMRSSRVLIAVIFVLTFVAYARQHLRGPPSPRSATCSSSRSHRFGTQYLIWPAANACFSVSDGPRPITQRPACSMSPVTATCRRGTGGMSRSSKILRGLCRPPLPES